jgi:hypothetical protein
VTVAVLLRLLHLLLVVMMLGPHTSMDIPLQAPFILQALLFTTNDTPSSTTCCF